MTPHAPPPTVGPDAVTASRPSSRRPPAIVVALAVPVIALIAILATRAVEGPSSAGGAAVGADTVVIRNFAFQPARLTVAPGTRVAITNRDNTTHTMSATNGAFDTGPLDGGTSTTITVTKAGTYAYRCRIHSTMHGTLVVR